MDHLTVPVIVDDAGRGGSGAAVIPSFLLLVWRGSQASDEPEKLASVPSSHLPAPSGGRPPSSSWGV